MDDRLKKPDSEVLPRPVAERLLKRASELDAVRNAGSAVAELRAAAAEAGISSDAFEAALGELQQAERPAPVAQKSARRWRGLFMGLAGIGALFLAAATIFIPARMIAPASTAMVEQAVQLNCIPSREAVDLITPILSNRANTIKVSPDGRALTVRATPEQLQRVRAAIDQVDNAQACARR